MSEVAASEGNRHKDKSVVLLTEEVRNYAAVAEGRAAMHRWIIKDTRQPFRDIPANPDGLFNFDAVDEDVHLEASLNKVGEPEYAGPLTTAQAIGELALLKEALKYQSGRPVPYDPFDLPPTQTVKTGKYL